MRDHICFFQKTKVVSKNLMMTLFLTVPRVLEGVRLFERDWGEFPN